MKYEKNYGYKEYKDPILNSVKNEYIPMYTNIVNADWDWELFFKQNYLHIALDDKDNDDLDIVVEFNNLLEVRKYLSNMRYINLGNDGEISVHEKQIDKISINLIEMKVDFSKHKLLPNIPL